MQLRTLMPEAEASRGPPSSRGADYSRNQTIASLRNSHDPSLIPLGEGAGIPECSHGSSGWAASHPFVRGEEHREQMSPGDTSVLLYDPVPMGANGVWSLPPGDAALLAPARRACGEYGGDDGQLWLVGRDEPPEHLSRHLQVLLDHVTPSSGLCEGPGAGRSSCAMCSKCRPPAPPLLHLPQRKWRSVRGSWERSRKGRSSGTAHTPECESSQSLPYPNDPDAGVPRFSRCQVMTPAGSGLGNGVAGGGRPGSLPTASGTGTASVVQRYLSDHLAPLRHDPRPVVVKVDRGHP